MAPVRLRVAVGIGMALLGLFGAVTGVFFTGMTPDGRLAQLANGRLLPSAVLLAGGVVIAVTGWRRR